MHHIQFIISYNDNRIQTFFTFLFRHKNQTNKTQQAFFILFKIKLTIKLFVKHAHIVDILNWTYQRNVNAVQLLHNRYHI